jgi:hypothetical protein
VTKTPLIAAAILALIGPVEAQEAPLGGKCTSMLPGQVNGFVYVVADGEAAIGFGLFNPPPGKADVEEQTPERIRLAFDSTAGHRVKVTIDLRANDASAVVENAGRTTPYQWCTVVRDFK